MSLTFLAFILRWLEIPLKRAGKRVSVQASANLIRADIQGRSDGGYIGIYTLPKSVYLKFFMWLFCLLAMTS